MIECVQPSQLSILEQFVCVSNVFLVHILAIGLFAAAYRNVELDRALFHTMIQTLSHKPGIKIMLNVDEKIIDTILEKLVSSARGAASGGLFGMRESIRPAKHYNEK